MDRKSIMNSAKIENSPKKKTQINGNFFCKFIKVYTDGTFDLNLNGTKMLKKIGRRLKILDMTSLAAFLTDNEKIETLDLSYNDFGDLGLQTLAENYFATSNNMKSLNLIQCDILGPGLGHLAKAPYLNLEKVELKGNKLGSEGSRFIADLILNCFFLTDLNIAETDQTPESINAILRVVEKSGLKSLDLSRIIPSSSQTKFNGDGLAYDLMTLLNINSTLTELHIQKCQLDGHNIEVLLEGLRQNNLLLLDLNANNMGDHGIELLANWLKTKPKLKTLMVAANNIGNEGARFLSSGLPFSQLIFLDISHNKIEDFGMTKILNSFKTTFAVRRLFFWGNKFGPKVNKIVNRMLQSGFLYQEYIDVKIYHVDHVAYSAHYNGKPFIFKPLISQ